MVTNDASPLSMILSILLISFLIHGVQRQMRYQNDVLKGYIGWEGLCCSCGYLVAMVTTYVLKMYPNSHDSFHYCCYRKQKYL